MAEIVMPRLSDTMEEGTILRWLVANDEQVQRGQKIVEIETDKATMTYESDLDGVLTIVAAEGETLPVGSLIAHVGSADAGAGDAASPDASATTPTVATVTPETAPASHETTLAPQEAGERVKASPVARRIAAEQSIDLHGLSGTGPGGRIVKADVEAAVGSDQAPAPERPTTAKGETTEVELSRTQQTIARRMAESKATIPHFALQMDIDMEECVALRAELKRLGRADAPTYNDMVVKACALALREHPRANSSYRDGRLQLHSRVNVGVAVATESQEPAGGGLIVPTVFDADVKALGEIARETGALTARVRDGSITPPELGGGTFTVSNLGMFGVDAFTAIINPPQAAILSVGAIKPRAVARDEGDEQREIVARQQMTVTLACDHRILYGADAARFLARIRELLEQPAALTL
ncbi:MAG TPA: dihydrolipoamide acetyltransferase family protein [Solirubrobacteraceae bacterium]|jgi:pyruvate dehydrogenase E2 component (dihydrolipoamide acetyltransferase)